MADNAKNNEEINEPQNDKNIDRLEEEIQAIEAQAETVKKTEEQMHKHTTQEIIPAEQRHDLSGLNAKISSMRNRVSLLTAVTVLFLAGGVAGGLYLTDNVRQAITETNAVKNGAQEANSRADRLIGVFSDQNTHIETLLNANDSLREENSSLKSQIASINSRIGEAEKKLISQGKTLARYEERNPDDWKVAQAYFLVNSAYQSAVFQGDPTSASWCLRDADSMLLNIEDPEVIKVRKAISNDLIALANIPAVDKRGIMFSIDSVCGNLNAMTLNGMDDSFGAQKEAKQKMDLALTDIGNWKDNLLRALSDFSSRFIEIRRRDEHALSEFLTSAQADTLRENIRSLLLLSKQALIQGDNVSYRNNLNQAIDLIRNYYDASADATKANLATLKSVVDLKISVDLPSVLSSYTIFRDIAQQRLKVVSPSTSPSQNTDNNTETNQQESVK